MLCTWPRESFGDPRASGGACSRAVHSALSHGHYGVSPAQGVASHEAMPLKVKDPHVQEDPFGATPENFA
jgi:hypothetical protein